MEHGGDAQQEGGAPGDQPRGDVALLLERVYDELRELSGRLMSREPAGHTLQPTVLVHEVYLKLSAESRSEWMNEAQFKAVAATVMRRTLVDHARRRTAAKRGGGARELVSMEGLGDGGGGLSPEQVLEIDDALSALRAVDERRAQVVEMRYFGGMSFDQVARQLGVSANTAKTDWRFARAWLQRRIGGASEGEGS